MVTRKERTAPSPARRAALEALRAVRARAAEPAGALHSAALESLSQEDRRLATEIVYGVLRWRARLDFELALNARRPLGRAHPDVLDALRIGLYQLRHLERVPPRAAVDESVRLTKLSRSAREAGFVNGVLRAVLRSPAPDFPSREADPLRYLTVTLSHPGWLARRYLDRLGIERAERRCRTHNEPPPVHARVARGIGRAAALRRLADEGVEAEPIAWLPDGLRIDRGSVVDTRIYAEGGIVIQDGGSQLVPLLLGIDGGDDVLDVCAAPGGKTSAMAERTRAIVVALDARERRARLLRDSLRRVSAGNVRIAVADGRALPLTRCFSRILLDVPCSSLGTLRRNPDVKWRLREEDLPRFAVLQKELLARAAERLDPGGRLVYATCSTEPEENEAIVRTFLESETGSRHRLLDARNALPASARHLCDAEGFLRTLPERDGVDGYFAALLERDD